MDKTRRREDLHKRWGFTESDIAVYGFGSSRPIQDAPFFLGYNTYRDTVRPALNDPASRHLIENKWNFYRLASSWNLPIPRTLGLYDPLWGTTWHGRPMRLAEQVLAEIEASRPEGIVLKASGGQQGRAIVIVEAIQYPSGHCRIRGGSDSTIFDEIATIEPIQRRGYRGWIVQEVAKQHSSLNDISPHPANTIRVVTLVHSNADVHMLGCVARLGRMGGAADNWDAGGISVHINPQTGTLGEGVIKPKHGGLRVSKHPDGGKPFRNWRIPQWDSILETCRRAARCFPGVRTVGWDILLTQEGHIILEGNANWDLQMVQVHSDGYLRDSVLRYELEQVGVELPSHGSMKGPGIDAEGG